MAYETVVASDGVVVPVESLEQNYTYNGAFIDYIEVSYRGVTYRQTYTYNGSHIATISEWEAQP